MEEEQVKKEVVSKLERQKEWWRAIKQEAHSCPTIPPPTGYVTPSQSDSSSSGFAEEEGFTTGQYD